jgi:hypothetical protein
MKDLRQEQFRALRLRIVEKLLRGHLVFLAVSRGRPCAKGHQPDSPSLEWRFSLAEPLPRRDSGA